MRLSKEKEDLTGKIGVCSVGRPFIITGTQTFDFGVAWVGLGLDGKGTVASTNPGIIAESGKEMHDKLFTRFGGKMTHND